MCIENTPRLAVSDFVNPPPLRRQRRLKNIPRN